MSWRRGSIEPVSWLWPSGFVARCSARPGMRQWSHAPFFLTESGPRANKGAREIARFHFQRGDASAPSPRLFALPFYSRTGSCALTL